MSSDYAENSSRSIHFVRDKKLLSSRIFPAQQRHNFLNTYSLRKKIAFYKNLKFRNLPESHSQASSDCHYSATDEPTSASSKDVVEAASVAIQSGKQS